MLLQFPPSTGANLHSATPYIYNMLILTHLDHSHYDSRLGYEGHSTLVKIVSDSKDEYIEVTGITKTS